MASGKEEGGGRPRGTPSSFHARARTQPLLPEAPLLPGGGGGGGGGGSFLVDFGNGHPDPDQSLPLTLLRLGQEACKEEWWAWNRPTARPGKDQDHPCPPPLAGLPQVTSLLVHTMGVPTKAPRKPDSNDMDTSPEHSVPRGHPFPGRLRSGSPRPPPSPGSSGTERAFSWPPVLAGSGPAGHCHRREKGRLPAEQTGATTSTQHTVCCSLEPGQPRTQRKTLHQWQSHSCSCSQAPSTLPPVRSSTNHLPQECLLDTIQVVHAI